jgi:hypothetical protein
VSDEAIEKPAPVPPAAGALATATAQAHALASAQAHGVSRTRKRLALAIAAASDLAQWFFFPAVVEGAASPFEIALDAITALAILVVVGFQWRLAIALVAELVPGLDMFPTWTLVVLSLTTTPAAPPPALPPAKPEG